MVENNQDKTRLELINAEINRELVNPDIHKVLMATVFKGLEAATMKKAIMEGMVRGFTFKDFLDKNVYAIPFNGKEGNGYSLITSIDYARKIAMKSGIVGKDAPMYEMDDKGAKIISCTVTVHKKFGNYIGDFTATVYFSEYTTGFNQWAKRPRTMIAKVAEMHALRMACPEELSQSYTEEEMGESINKDGIDDVVDSSSLKMGNFNKNDKNKKEGDENQDQGADSVDAEVIS